MIQQEMKKIGKRSFIYTTTTEPDKYFIQDENGYNYDSAYDVQSKVYVEVERPKKEDEKPMDEETL